MTYCLTGLILGLSVACCAADSAGHVSGIDIGPDYEARVRRGIEQNRKSDACIRLVNHDGKAIVGADITIRQTSHDFLFGCAFPAWEDGPRRLGADGWANWCRLFTRLFNYTTSENAIKWPHTEPREGELNWRATDFMIGWCRDNGVAIKGHTLVWGLEKHGVPQWLESKDPTQIADLARKRILTTIGRCRSDIHYWDVVNEPIHCRWFDNHWGKNNVLMAYKWAREADPNAVLLINDYAGFRGEAARFVPFVKRLLRAGAPIDAMGEQSHDPPWWYSPREILETLDKMATAGLDIHLTEVTYPSNDSEITGGFVTGKWDEAKQGEFYRYLLTLAFSHPKVKAFTLWAMWDGSTWLPQGGIVRKDWTPKPAYKAMDELINRTWRTSLRAVSDINGEVRFRGFHGDYEVAVALPDGRTKTTKMHVGQGTGNALKLEL